MPKVAGVWVPGCFVQPSCISGWTGGGMLIRVPIDGAVLVRLFEMFTAEGRAWKYARGNVFVKQADLWIGDVPKHKRPLCGAKTRKGTPCQTRCVDGKERCRLHGGLSTGAKTAEGRARIAESNRRRARAQAGVGSIYSKFFKPAAGRTDFFSFFQFGGPQREAALRERNGGNGWSEAEEDADKLPCCCCTSAHARGREQSQLAWPSQH